MPLETRNIRLLLVEDSAADAELVVRALRAADIGCDEHRIDTRSGWDAALADPLYWDLVLLDFRIPHLNTLVLLADLRERAPHVPAIVVSGSITEESAVSVLRAGARDFVTKQNMARLAPAVRREVGAASHARKRHSAEVALVESEARLARLIDNNAQDIVMRYRVSPELAFEYVSPSIETILGYTPEALYADPRLALRMIHPDDRERAKAAFEDDPETAMTSRAVTADGRTVWLDRRQVAIRDERDEVVAFECVARNVTAQVLARAELKTKEEKFRAIFEGARDALLLSSDDRVYVDANPAACALLGLPLEEILGHRVEEFSAVDAADVAAGWAVFLNEGRQDGEFLLRCPDGTTRWTEFAATANVEPGVHLSILRDVSLRKKQAQELARSEERFRLAQEGARMGTWDVDLRSDTMTWSDGLRNLYGVDQDYPAGLEGFAALLHPDDREWVTDGVVNKERNGESWEFECRILRPDGELAWILSRSTPIRDEDGILTRVLGVTVDTTAIAQSREALREAEEKLRHAQKMEAIGQLAGGIAHDFNNLLTVINGYGDIALDQCGENTGVRDSLTEIRRAGSRAAELTQQLLALSRRQVLMPEVVDLNEVVTEHASMLARLLGEDIVLQVTPNAREGYVEADPGQLTQVILNLAANARDAMPTGGELGIRTATLEQVEEVPGLGLSAGSYVTLEVTDTGSGMDAATQRKIFDPFFTTKEVGKGTGLGLSTVLGIVEQSKGHIDIRSKPGEGTTFTIYLPRSEPPTAAPAVTTTDTHAQANETVLLVEDNDVVRELVHTILLERGYTVLVADGPSAAIVIADSCAEEIHLLVTDVVMPEMNGRELAERLLEARPHMRALYMSGYPNDAMIARGVLPSGMLFLQKPFTAAQLGATARRALASASS